MDDFIGEGQAMVYFGLRSDEPDRAGAMQTKHLTPKYPLREAGIGINTVYKIVETRGLLPPSFFWGRLYRDAVQMTDGDAIIANWPQWSKDRLFAWRSRPNCFFCFFQRRYEWAGLLEHHPDLFERAEEIERVVGNGPNTRRSTGIQWIEQDYPLSKIRELAPAIYNKRLIEVCRTIMRRQYTQQDLFFEAKDEMDEAATSCGLLCGK